MTLEQQQEVFEHLTKRMSEVMLSKGTDYATDDDRLNNFKVAGGIVGATPEINCLHAIATKVARLGILLSKTTKPNNESIEDNLLDLANYSVLLYMLRHEKLSEQKTRPQPSIHDSDYKKL